MKVSFLGSATYQGPAPGFNVWPAPPEACDRTVASNSLNQTIENCRRAEELGFDWVSVSEHHYAPTMLTPNPVVLAGALSQACKRVKIAMLGPLLPLANPVRVAEEVAMIDSISNGRAVVLFLRGTPSEHNVYLPVAEQSREMTQEGIDLILKAWTSPKPFSWEGKHFQFKNVSVWPRTVQEPHPPVFGSGNSEESARFAAERRIGLAMSFMPSSAVKRIVDIYKSEAKQAGWAPGPDHVLYRGMCSISDSGDYNDSNYDKADKAALESGKPAPGFVFGAFFSGGPRNILRQIDSLREAGVGIIDMNVGSAGGGGFGSQAGAMELFARQVLPEIRSW
jgi:alkanesulfonate monooxygenase SsuD/methylene tetrahydromethanopterin reductase-like flavin-dependent oxidoreductase (luciferase family)